MIPMCFVSAFMNNTPVVALMIPIVQRWSQNIGFSSQQLLIPLSYSSIMGGTCSLIGTSTNLVVLGLYQARYPNEPPIGLFDLSVYGVPIAMIGMVYIMLCSPYLLPGSNKDNNEATDDTILLRARLTKWSSAAGRSVKRSGLRDTGGVYLVSVQRAATGNIHRAVGQDFILNIGDTLYFTGLVEGFGQFCDENALELVTNEDDDDTNHNEHNNNTTITKSDEGSDFTSFRISTAVDELPQIRSAKESILNIDPAERLRCVNRITDLIRGFTPSKQNQNEILGGTSIIQSKLLSSSQNNKTPSKSVKFSDAKTPEVIVVEENINLSSIILVAVDAPDRPGLLLDISKTLLKLHLQLHHTEASVQSQRSMSVWRCEPIKGHALDLEEIWTVLHNVLEDGGGEMKAIKKRGLQVIRGKITERSRLIGKQVKDVDFRTTYKAAIVSVIKGGSNITTESLSDVELFVGDVLILQANNDSPLLALPEDDFYTKVERHRKFSFGNLMNLVAKTVSSSGDITKMARSVSSEKVAKLAHSASAEKVIGKITRSRSNSMASADSKTKEEDDIPNGTNITIAERQHSEDYGGFIDIEESGSKSPKHEYTLTEYAMTQEDKEKENQVRIWLDLQILSPDDQSTQDKGVEFLTAMQVSQSSKLATKTVLQLGFNKLPNIFLVSIERPATAAPERTMPRRMTLSHSTTIDENSSFVQLEAPKNIAIDVDEPLQPGDILWFSGSANAVGELRKIPGLSLFEKEEINQIEGKVFDRRLVQAVVARTGPLVGKTMIEVKFRTKYGAAVIAIHREGKKIMEHPGQVKLHAGDVLLLEAGPTFFERNTNKDRAFVLLSEVENSSPPRLKLFIPALLLMIAMLALYTAGLGSLLVFALLASMAMIFIGVLSEQEARDAVNWEIYVTIACAFGIGTALTNSGVAEKIANGLVYIGTSFGSGDAGLFAAVYLATFILSSIVTNNAAAALMFPIAMGAAEKTGTNVLLMCYNLMLAASASFMTPFGYQTNLMVYGPGKYKTKDFLKFGTPLQIVLWIYTTSLLTLHKQWWISWIASVSILVATSLLSMFLR